MIADSIAESLTYYPYWTRVVSGAFVVGVILVLELAALIWLRRRDQRRPHERHRSHRRRIR